MNHPAYSQPPAYPAGVDWGAVQRQASDLIQFLCTIDQQRNRISQLEESVQRLANSLTEAHRQLAEQHKQIQNLDRGLRDARARFEDENTALHERLTEVLEHDYRTDNPNATTAVAFGRDEALEKMEALIAGLQGTIAKQMSARRGRDRDGQEALEVAAALAEGVETLFGNPEVDDQRLAHIVGNQQAAEFAATALAIREQLATCAPSHSWHFAFIPGERLNADQEASNNCPADGVAQYVVRPGYVEGGRLIRKQRVFTVDARHP